MTYSEALEFLFSQFPSYHNIGKAAYKNDLSNIILLDNYFKNPHRQFLTIHVAGTNGKGSVSHMISSVLQEAGYKTGLFTSPHLKDFRERIRVNGELIPENYVVTFVTKHKDIISNIRPSFFEMTVAMAFNYFAECDIDVAVVEVGLGGRLDSTNIINPVLSVITNIGHDHMDILGDTLGKVALEKAGIIKKNIPVIISETHPETKDVFLQKAKEVNAPIYFADTIFSCKLANAVNDEGGRNYLITELSTGSQYEGMAALAGNYQQKNLIAVSAAFQLLKKVFDISNVNVTDGIRKVIVNTGLSGRWQILGRSPLTICDTGHNKEGLEYVTDQLKSIPNSGLHIVVGFVNDKDLSSVLPLFPENAVYYFTKASIPRALNESILKSKASDYGLKGESYSDVKSALKAARKQAKSTDLIFIGGSTFVVAEVID
jgi:dihydrofolate synthase / folylpolyglutamate synthase